RKNSSWLSLTTLQPICCNRRFRMIEGEGSGKFEGRKAIVFARASNKVQEKSTPEQIRDMERLCAREGIVVVDRVELEGVSGTRFWKRIDIDALIDRKQTRNDFDLLIVYD